MDLFICTFCGKQTKSKKSLIGHQTFCKKNPNYKVQNTKVAREKALQLKTCKYCSNTYTLGNINRHERSCAKNPTMIKDKTKICPVCSNFFMGNSTTCSYSCSNTYFRHSRKGGTQYKSDDILIENSRYRDLCFRYHHKKCIICGEENIISVHHLNENHNDNRPENLIPLCPTHHQYCHSNFKYLIDKQIEEYILKWKMQGIGKSG